MAKRVISAEFFDGCEPNAEAFDQIERAFADMGWKLSYSFGGGSNVFRWGMSIESEDGEMSQATFLAMLERFGFPLSTNPSIHGDFVN